MRYHTSVIISLFSALGSLAASSRKLMKTGAYALRISQLQDVAAEIAAGAPSEGVCLGHLCFNAADCLGSAQLLTFLVRNRPQDHEDKRVCVAL